MSTKNSSMVGYRIFFLLTHSGADARGDRADCPVAPDTPDCAIDPVLRVSYHNRPELTRSMLALDAYLADRAAAARAAAAPVVQGNGKEKAAAKRKAASQTSRGVEQLKKVKTEGMAKLTSFFKPKDK